MVSPGVVPPELTASLKALAPLLPEASRRASAALEWILNRALPARDEPHDGKLTGDGFPVELVFSSLDTAIRYTCEVPGLAPKQRLNYACRLSEALGQPLRFPLARLQEGCASLEWGAWLGGRHTATTDRYKVYAEAPDALTPAAISELNLALGDYRTLLESHAYALRIAGFAPGSQRLELYFRGRGLEPRELRGLLQFSGLADQQENLFSLLEAASRQPARVRLPGNQHGFSISLDPRGELDMFTFFVFARSLFGADPVTRSALLTLSESRGWNLEHYAAVSALLQRRQTRGPHHGIVSFIVKRHDLPGVSIGLRPGIA
ncbi:MAG TPA: hypothetical protein VIS96_10400 [Terrimicrobiaceae bacterium]